MEPKQVAKEFSAELQRTLGSTLHSVMLYGSAVRGEWLESTSDINVLVVIDDINGASLAAASPVVRKFATRRVHPIVVESREWAHAADVFAIETADMHDANEQLFGESALSVAPILLPILRLQAERELRGKLLQVYLGMLITETPDQLGKLLMSTVPSITTYMRTALRLVGQAVPMDTADVLPKACDLVGGDAQPLLRVLAARRGKGDLAVPLTDPLVDSFNTTTEKLVQFIDNYGR